MESRRLAALIEAAFTEVLADEGSATTGQVTERLELKHPGLTAVPEAVDAYFQFMVAAERVDTPEGHRRHAEQIRRYARERHGDRAMDEAEAMAAEGEGGVH